MDSFKDLKSEYYKELLRCWEERIMKLISCIGNQSGVSVEVSSTFAVAWHFICPFKFCTTTENFADSNNRSDKLQMLTSSDTKLPSPLFRLKDPIVSDALEIYFVRFRHFLKQTQ